MSTPISELLHDPRLWRASQAPTYDPAEFLATGFSALDTALLGGWPVGALTEILVPHPGIGELRLLTPALARLSREPRWLAWVAPPFIPYAPALAAHGIDLARVLIVHPQTEDDALWAVEQALRAGTCGAVLAWVKRSDTASMRRLQLAAEAGGSWGIVFRSQYSVVQTSPAALRLRLAARPGGVAVEILKRRGGWPMGPIALDFSAPHSGRAPVKSRVNRAE